MEQMLFFGVTFPPLITSNCLWSLVSLIYSNDVRNIHQSSLTDELRMANTEMEARAVAKAPLLLARLISSQLPNHLISLPDSTANSELPSLSARPLNDRVVCGGEGEQKLPRPQGPSFESALRRPPKRKH